MAVSNVESGYRALEDTNFASRCKSCICVGTFDGCATRCKSCIRCIPVRTFDRWVAAVVVISTALCSMPLVMPLVSQWLNPPPSIQLEANITVGADWVVKNEVRLNYKVPPGSLVTGGQKSVYGSGYDVPVFDASVVSDSNVTVTDWWADDEHGHLFAHYTFEPPLKGPGSWPITINAKSRAVCEGTGHDERGTTASWLGTWASKLVVRTAVRIFFDSSLDIDLDQVRLRSTDSYWIWPLGGEDLPLVVERNSVEFHKEGAPPHDMTWYWLQPGIPGRARP